MENNIKLVIGDSWTPKLLPYFAIATITLMLITNILNLKFINFFGMSVIASQFVYILSLIVSDIMSEVYGYKRVRKILYACLLSLITYAVFVQIGVHLEPAKDYASNDAFVTIFAQAPRIVFASISAYFLVELTNSFIMSRLKVYFSGRHFCSRAIFSTAIAQIVNATAFFGIAYTGIMPLNAIIAASVFSWCAVILTEIIILPLTKFIAIKIKTIEGIEHFDSEPTEQKRI